MANLQHPAPGGMHGLLTVRRGPTHAFSKRVRRLATLENGILTLRPSAESSPDMQINILGSTITLDKQSHTLTVTLDDGKLRLSTRTKLSLWTTALIASSKWIACTHYKFNVPPPPAQPTPNSALSLHALDCSQAESGTRLAMHVLSLSPARTRYIRTIFDASVRILHVVATACTTCPSLLPVRDIFHTPCSAHVIYDARLQHSVQCVLNRARATGKALSESTVAHIMQALFSALTVLHSHCVVHRSVSLSALAVPDGALDPEWDGRGVMLGAFNVSTFSTKRSRSKTNDHSNSKEIVNELNLHSKHMRIQNAKQTQKENEPPNLNKYYEYESVKRSVTYHKKASFPNLYQALVNDTSNSSTSCCVGESPDETCGNNPTFCDPLYIGSTLKHDSVGGDRVFASGIDKLSLTDAVAAPAYAAPEIVQLLAHGAPVDMWAAGVAMAQLLGAALPEGKCAFETLCAVKNGYEMDVDTSLKMVGVSEGARQLVAALLRVDGRRRLTACAALENHWLVSHSGTETHDIM